MRQQNRDIGNFSLVLAWNQAHFDEIDAAIRDNPVWQSPLWSED